MAEYTSNLQKNFKLRLNDTFVAEGVTNFSRDITNVEFNTMFDPKNYFILRVSFSETSFESNNKIFNFFKNYKPMDIINKVEILNAYNDDVLFTQNDVKFYRLDEQNALDNTHTNLLVNLNVLFALKI